MNNRRFCEDCEIDIHRASYSKHLRSEKHMKNEEKNLTRKVRTIFETMFGPNGIVLKTSSGKEISLDKDRVNQLYSKYKYKNNCM